MKKPMPAVLGFTYCTGCKKAKKTDPEKGVFWEKLTKEEYAFQLGPHLDRVKIIRALCPDCEPKPIPPKQSVLSLLVSGARKFFSLSATA